MKPTTCIFLISCLMMFPTVGAAAPQPTEDSPSRFWFDPSSIMPVAPTRFGGMIQAAFPIVNYEDISDPSVILEDNAGHHINGILGRVWIETSTQTASTIEDLQEIFLEAAKENKWVPYAA